MDRKQFENLREGDIVRGDASGETYVVLSNYGRHVIAVRMVDMTNPDEWTLIDTRASRVLRDQINITMMQACPGCGLVPPNGHRPGCPYG